jgi:hypothetical protein
MTKVVYDRTGKAEDKVGKLTELSALEHKQRLKPQFLSTPSLLERVLAKDARLVDS